MELHFLKELLIVLSATIAIVYLFQRLRLPTIVGFLLTGMVIGPNGVGLIDSVAPVEILAEIGVALLLFTIGIEFSLEELRALPRRVIWVGLLQIGLTVAGTAALAFFLGAAARQAIFFGFLVALSSTAIVLRLYHERGEMHSLPGRAVSGVLFLQDLSIVPMMLLVPVLGRTAGASGWDILAASLAAIAVLLLTVVVARKLLPLLLHHIAVLKNREVFILVVLWICLGTAWLIAQTGLSLALGALVAGLIISESHLSHQVVADVLPLRDCFSGIFFISIGMLLDLETLYRAPLPPLLQLGTLLVIKGVVVFSVVWLLFRSMSVALVLAFSLAQVGEFSFVLAKSGALYGLLTGKEEQGFLAASILSMIATPWLIQFGRRLAHGPARHEPPALEGLSPGAAPARDLVLVVGYGVNGRNLTRVLKEVGVPYAVIELDPDLVRDAAAAGEPMSFGDATRPDILRQAGIENARVLVIAISDPGASARIVAQARRLRGDLHIIVRTRYVAEIERLQRLGANEVIPEEFETSIEIFSRVLDRLHVPRNVISLQVEIIRQGHYGMLRGLRLQGKQLDELNRFLLGATVDIFTIMDGSAVVGCSLEELALQRRSAASLIAVVRDGKSIYSFANDFRLRVNDLLVLLGSHKALDEAQQILRPASGDNADQ